MGAANESELKDNLIPDIAFGLPNASL